MGDEIRVLIGGDLCPIGRLEGALRNGDESIVAEPLLDVIRSADIALCNLECPLTDARSPSAKTGPNLRAHPECARGIRQLGFALVGLANNHIMYYGAAGLASTLTACERHGLRTVGAGHTFQEAQQLSIQHVNGRPLAVMAMAEHEFGTAAVERCGVNPLDVIHYTRTLQRDVSSCRNLIVLLHAGAENHAYPSLWLRDTCRFLVEQGAKVVVCQHSHIPAGYENYAGGVIVYGQGNLLFDYPSQFPEWNDGYLLDVTISEQSTVASPVPYRFDNGDGRLLMLENGDKDAFVRRIESRSKVVSDDHELANRWAAFCDTRRDDLLANAFGLNRPLRFLNRKTGLLNRLLGCESKRLMLNQIRCESLREALIEVLWERDQFRRT